MWLIMDTVWLDEHDRVLLSFEEKQLGEYLDSLLGRIASCNDVYDADEPINGLDQFQRNLAKAWFQYEVNIPSRCKELVRQADHLEIFKERESIFNQIKNRQFCTGHDVVEVQEKVLLVDATTAIYVCGKRKMEFHMETYPEGMIFDIDTITSWLPPYDDKHLSDWKKKLIQKRISEYCEKRNIVYGWI